MEQNNGNGNGTGEGEIVPQKKKRGRPRKSDQLIAGSAEKKVNKVETKKNTLDSNATKGGSKTKKSMNMMSPNLAVTEEGQVSEVNRPFVGRSVHGVVDGCFESGYLVTIRVKDTNIVYRGVVFGPGISVPVENGRDMVNNKDGLTLQASKDDNEEEDLDREDGLNTEEQQVMENEDDEDRGDEEEEEDEEEDASESPRIDEASKFRVYNNHLPTQMQTQRQMIAQTTQIPFQTPSGSAFKPLSTNTVLSSIGSGSATMLANANANPYSNANAYAYANANAPNVNINATEFAPEAAFRASPFDQEMLRFMYPGGLPEPQVYPNHPIMSNPSTINSGIYRQVPFPVPSASSTLTNQYNASPDVPLNPHVPPHPTSDL